MRSLLVVRTGGSPACSCALLAREMTTGMRAAGVQPLDGKISEERSGARIFRAGGRVAPGVARSGPPVKIGWPEGKREALLQGGAPATLDSVDTAGGLGRSSSPGAPGRRDGNDVRDALNRARTGVVAVSRYEPCSMRRSDGEDADQVPDRRAWVSWIDPALTAQSRRRQSLFRRGLRGTVLRCPDRGGEAPCLATPAPSGRSAGWRDQGRRRTREGAAAAGR